MFRLSAEMSQARDAAARHRGADDLVRSLRAQLAEAEALRDACAERKRRLGRAVLESHKRLKKLINIPLRLGIVKG